MLTSAYSAQDCLHVRMRVGACMQVWISACMCLRMCV